MKTPSFFVCVASLCASGCFLDLDYQTGCKPGQVFDGNACRVVDECAANELPLVGGGCKRIGVLKCGNIGIEEDGGCALFVPEPPCAFGSYYPSMSDVCLPLRSCPLTAGLWPAEDGVNFTEDVEVPGEYPSIAAALDAHPGSPLTIRLAEGTYPESVLVTRKVQIVGRCASETTLVPATPGQPAITFGPGSEGSYIHDLALAEGDIGVRVRGGDVRFDNVHAHDLTGTAFQFDDARAESKIERSLIENVGTGIEARGSSVAVSAIEVRNVAGIAIRAHPSRAAGATEKLTWDPRLSERSSITIDAVVIDDAHGAGILVEGSVGSVTNSVVRNIERDERTGAWRGIAAEWRPTGAVSSELHVAQSAVLGPFDIGVDVWNADISLDNVVVDGRSEIACATLGIGIRVRDDEPFDPTTTPSTPSITNALVRGVPHSGVRIEGTAARIEHVIVRDVGRSCASDQGDGVSVASYQTGCAACAGFSAAGVELVESRIDRSARAGAAAFSGAELAVAASLFECNARGVVGATASGHAVCRCGDALSLCPVDDGPLLDPLVGGSPCRDDDPYVCPDWAFGAMLLSGAPAPLQSVTVRVLEPTNVAPRLTDSSGRIALEGVFGDGQRVLQLATVAGHVARSHAFGVGRADQQFGWTLNLIPFELGALVVDLGWKLDLSLGLVQFELCRRPAPLPSEPPEIIPEEYCGGAKAGYGIPGAEVWLEPLPEGPEDDAVVHFTTDDAIPVPNPSLTVSEGKIIFVEGVRPGYRTIWIRLPPDPKLTCSSDVGGGWLAGWDFEQGTNGDWRTVSLSLPVEEARFSAGTYVMCEP